jgi:hypothetical protein
MVFRALQIAIVFCLLTPSAHAGPTRTGWLQKGVLACSFVLMTYGVREGLLGRQDAFEGSKARAAAADSDPEAAIRYLTDAQRLYESAAQHSKNSVISSAGGAVFSLGLAYTNYRGLVGLGGSYSSVRFTHIPEGLRLFHNGEECVVTNGSAYVLTLSDAPQIVELRRAEELVPISSLGSLILIFPLGQHLNVRIDSLIEKYRAADSQNSQP